MQASDDTTLLLGPASNMKSPLPNLSQFIPNKNDYEKVNYCNLPDAHQVFTGSIHLLTPHGVPSNRTLRGRVELYENENKCSSNKIAF